ncbi:MAG: Asp-tRNA(Asn)/Glu-tRNA(Gln) amidotransferase subunit GatC [Candidatus Saccharimonadales bacterium]
MAKLSRDDVLKLAQLARIKLTDLESDNFANEITKILDYVGQLKDVDVSGLKPTNHVTGLSNVWREDKVIDYGYSKDQLLKNVPKVKNHHIQVGRMIE